VFAALPDRVTPGAWGALRTIVGPRGFAVVMRRELPEPPAGWELVFTQGCRQMVWTAAARAARADAEAKLDAGARVEALGEPDVPAMLALVEHARPGPFLRRTVELGAYVGIREGAALIAMAGERMHPAGYGEVSAVCTDAAHRGRGLASRLVRTIAHRILDRDETPFLHLTLENETAHRVYRALGFETRAKLQVIGLRAPG